MELITKKTILFYLLPLIVIGGAIGTGTIIDAYAVKINTSDYTAIYATVTYSITVDDRVQLDIQMYDDELNPTAHNISYDIEIRQQDGHKTSNGHDRTILFVPYDETNTSGFQSHQSEVMYYPVGGQHKVFIESTIHGVGQTEPFPTDFEVTISGTLNNENAKVFDFRP